MTITKERKTELVAEYKQSPNDTGSPEVQIAVLTTGVILFVRSHMLGQTIDPCRKNRDLDFRRTGIHITSFEFLDQFLLTLFGDGHSRTRDKL